MAEAVAEQPTRRERRRLEIRQRIVSGTALQRHAQPHEIAGTAVYLLSEASAYTTGETIVVDGGMTIT